MKSVEERRAAASNSWNLFVSLAVGAALASAGGAIAQTAPTSQSSQPAPQSSQPAPQSSQPTAQSSQPAAQPSKAKVDPQDKVICKHQEDTGSRLGGSRVCHTKREWDQIAKEGRDLVNDAQTHVNGERY